MSVEKIKITQEIIQIYDFSTQENIGGKVYLSIKKLTTYLLI